MKIKKIPMRTCVVTKEKYPKKELLRVVRTPEGKVIIDEMGRANGHGAYLKKDLAVINKAMANKALAKYLEIEIPDSIYEQLSEIVRGVADGTND